MALGNERPTISIPNLAALMSAREIDDFFVAVDSLFINEACDAAFASMQPYRSEFTKDDLNGSCEVQLSRTGLTLQHDRSLVS
jgi:hypothetical protein